MTDNVIPKRLPILGFSPSDHLGKIVPEDLSRDFSITPLCVSDHELWLAAAYNLSVEEERTIERIVRYPLRTVQVGYLEVKRLQSRLYEKTELQPGCINPQNVLDRMDIDPHEKWISELETMNAMSPSTLTNWLQWGWLTDNQWGELIGLCRGLPSRIHAESTAFNTLLHFIPIDSAFWQTQNYFIPLCWVKDTLFLGINDFSQIDEVVHLTDQWHMKRSYVLIPPGLHERLSTAHDPDGLFNENIPEEDIAEGLIDERLLTRDKLNAAKTLMKSTGISLREALTQNDEDLKYHWLANFANLRDIIPVYESDLPKGFDQRLIKLFELLPYPFCRLLTALPLNFVDQILIIGLPDNHPGLINILQDISGCQVEARLMDENVIKKWLRKIYEALPQPKLPEVDVAHVKQYLLSTKLVQPGQLEKLNIDNTSSIPHLLSRLASEGLIDERNIAQTFGILFQTPYCSLEQYQFNPELISQFSQPFLREHQMLPLLQNDNDIWVAVDSPLHGDKLAHLAEISSRRVWPVIVPRSRLERVIKEYVSHIPSTEKTLHLTECIDYLIQRGVINPTDKPRIIHDVVEKGRLFDQVIKENLNRPQENIYEIFAEFREVPFVSLEPVRELQEMVDPLGNRIEQMRSQDPVNASLARRLDYETAKRLGALPLEIVDDGITVAFAHPLFDKAQSDLQRLFDENLLPVITDRESLEAAIERNLGRTNIGQLLMTSGLITRSQLNDGLNLAENTNTRIGQALIHRGYITEKQLYSFLSRQADMPLFDLSKMTLSKEAAKVLTPDEQWEKGVLPLSRDRNSIVLGVVDPISQVSIEYVERKTGLQVKPVLITENDFENALEWLYQEHYTAQSVSALLSREPENSAAQVLTKQQWIWMIIILVISIALAIWNIKNFLIIVNSIFTIIYLSMVVYKFFLVSAAIGTDLEVPVSEEEIRALRDDELPIYTIFIPVYKEAAVLPKLLDSITNLDYPKIKLDVKVLLEEDDEETIAAFKEIDPPDYIQDVIVPTSQPKTKPKACNYGLIRARGEYAVIFDAEDQPDSDQLKRVIVAFNKIPADVICIQVKLNYFNRNQNLLTRWFSIEYSMWFDLFLPGLDARNVPIPLGGTSNHFKKYALVEAGAWDPHNVTEDADLGIRLYKLGYRTRIVDTTTYEEANSKVNNWIRQRSRWVKGYIQTWLVHMRHPIKLIRDIGLKAFFSFQMVVGGNIFTVLINPIYWLLTTVWFILPFDFITDLFPGPIYYLGAFSLFFGNFAFTYINVAGAMSREYYEMVRAALISPLYWGLMSIGGWKGFLQLITKPHYWEKTIHGLDQAETNIEEDDEFLE